MRPIDLDINIPFRRGTGRHRDMNDTAVPADAAATALSGRPANGP